MYNDTKLSFTNQMNVQWYKVEFHKKIKLIKDQVWLNNFFTIGTESSKWSVDIYTAV